VTRSAARWRTCRAPTSRLEETCSILPCIARARQRLHHPLHYVRPVAIQPPTSRAFGGATPHGLATQSPVSRAVGNTPIPCSSRGWWCPRRCDLAD
jgi:hypothetical protein